MRVIASNTVAADEVIHTSAAADLDRPDKVLVQNTGAAVLYLNFDAAADNTHLQVAAGGSIELDFIRAQAIHGFCATSTTVVVLARN